MISQIQTKQTEEDSPVSIPKYSADEKKKLRHPLSTFANLSTLILLEILPVGQVSTL